MTKNMCLSATEAVKMQCGQKCCFNDRDLEAMMYQLGWFKLVTESNFSKLIKMARVTKTIIRQYKAKDLSMVLLR